MKKILQKALMVLKAIMKAAKWLIDVVGYIIKKLPGKKVIIPLLFIIMVSGCANIPANRLAEKCWKYKVELIINNNRLNQKQKELWIINIMQANGFSAKEITKYIKQMKEWGK